MSPGLPSLLLALLLVALQGPACLASRQLAAAVQPSTRPQTTAAVGTSDSVANHFFEKGSTVAAALGASEAPATDAAPLRTRLSDNAASAAQQQRRMDEVLQLLLAQGQQEQAHQQPADTADPSSLAGTAAATASRALKGAKLVSWEQELASQLRALLQSSESLLGAVAYPATYGGAAAVAAYGAPAYGAPVYGGGFRASAYPAVYPAVYAGVYTAAYP